MGNYQVKSASTWNFFKWRPSVPFVDRLAKMACSLLLIIGSVSSGCAGFRAIPILVALAPLNLFVIPKFVVTILCIISFVAGAVAFYTQYNEDVIKITDRFVRWYAYPEPIPISENALSALRSRSDFIAECCTKIKIQNGYRIDSYDERLDKIKSKISADTHKQLRLKLQEITDGSKVQYPNRQSV
jgi:hypothetical protein